MNAPTLPPFPLNPQVGTRYGNYVWNGATWVCSPTTGVQVLTTVFTASGPYMPSPGLVSVTVEAIGGGGAGGPSQITYSGTAWKLGASGGGGGAGEYARKTLPASLVLGGVIVTIGAGGDPGGSNSNNPGGNGAATSFGALCVANGGEGGGSNSINGNDTALTQTGGYGQGGIGGAGGIGDWTVNGSAGSLGPFEAEAASAIVEISVAIGRGGAGAYGGSPWGGLGLGGQTGGAAGTAAEANTGAGGGAGWCAVAPGGGPQNSYFGGAGGSGVCVVTEFCWATAAGEDCSPPINVNARVALTHVPWPGPGPCPPGWGQLDYDGDG